MEKEGDCFVPGGKKVTKKNCCRGEECNLAIGRHHRWTPKKKGGGVALRSQVKVRLGGKWLIEIGPQMYLRPKLFISRCTKSLAGRGEQTSSKRRKERGVVVC